MDQTLLGVHVNLIMGDVSDYICKRVRAQITLSRVVWTHPAAVEGELLVFDNVDVPRCLEGVS